MKKILKILIFVLIIISVIFISIVTYFSKVAEGEAKYSICSEHRTYFCEGPKVEKGTTIPCSNDDDCHIDFWSYCKENTEYGTYTWIGLPLCAGCRTYCGREGCCKYCMCNPCLIRLLNL